MRKSSPRCAIADRKELRRKPPFEIFVNILIHELTKSASETKARPSAGSTSLGGKQVLAVGALRWPRVIRVTQRIHRKYICDER
jgi:hypothetical protein